MAQLTDDPVTWHDTSTREGQENVGKSYAEKGWSAPKWREGQSWDAHQNELAGYNSSK